MTAMILSNEPSAIVIRTDDKWHTLARAGADRWEAAGLAITMKRRENTIALELEAPTAAVRTIKLRWNEAPAGNLLLLGDHWERGYGDLEWRGIVPERVMPWYFLAHDGLRTAGYGVKTGANSLCYWQLDTDGVTFTADVTSGNSGVCLGARTLSVADIIFDPGTLGETPFAAARRFCAMMCDKPLMPKQPVYGGNNWYYAYGESSHREILEDSRFISSLSSNTLNRPYMVIDDGWQSAKDNGGSCNGGPWIGNSKFTDMERLAGEMKEIGVKPGLWFRPLLTTENVPAEWIRYKEASTGSSVLDPSIPDVLAHIRESVERMVGYGFDMLKHDFTTYDMLGQWGFTMKSKPHALPYAFHDRSKTTAEITLALYRTIAEASGQADIIGCNTFSHLSAGLFEIQRTGDDTSGRWWERTRYMGVNTMAFRMAQHGTFYSHDADCLGLTKDVPWSYNREWLRLLAGSGTPLFVSADPAIVTKEQELELRAAFELAAQPLPVGEPLDWLRTTCPSCWVLNGEETSFQWNEVSAELLDEKDNGWWV
ncbi:alpha-galactosidase [Paenibacillus sp. CF384]|nr:alpha-galactosidase [Paenibacillus sp. CF384]